MTRVLNTCGAGISHRLKISYTCVWIKMDFMLGQVIHHIFLLNCRFYRTGQGSVQVSCSLLNLVLQYNINGNSWMMLPFFLCWYCGVVWRQMMAAREQSAYCIAGKYLLSLWLGNILLLFSIKPVQSHWMKWRSIRDHTYVMYCASTHSHSWTSSLLHRVYCLVALLFSWKCHRELR